MKIQLFKIMIGRKSILASFSQMFVKILKSIIFIIAVNTFSPINFGYYQIGVSTMAIFMLFSDLGFSSVHVKKMAEMEDKNATFTTFLILRFLLTIISSFIILLMIFFLISNRVLSSSIEQIWILIILYIQTLFNNDLSSIYELSFRANMKIAKMKIPLIISTIIGCILSLIAILYLRNFYFYLIAIVIESIIKFLILTYLGRNLKIKKLNLDLFKSYIKMGVSFLIPSIFLVLINSLGPFLFLNYFDEELLGVYNVIVTTIGMIALAFDTLRILLIPNYTMLLKSQKVQNLNSTIELGKKYLITIVVIIIITGVIFSDFILINFFGKIYFENGLLLYYFTLLSLLEYPLILLYTPLILAGEKFKVYSLVKFCEFVFSLICWIFLIPLLGIIAINLGKWLFIIINTIILRKFFQKEFKIGKVSKVEIIHLFIIGILVFLSFLISVLSFNLYFSLLSFLLIIGFYLVFLLIFKIIKKEDLKYILDLFNPFKMKDYIKSEFSNDNQNSE